MHVHALYKIEEKIFFLNFAFSYKKLYLTICEWLFYVNQVLSQSKLFSSSSTKFGSEPNTQVSLVDSGFPGMLPVINQFCVEQSIKTGLGLKAKINLNSVFDRKNYFYADLPQGYQISQYKNPIVGEGEVILDMPYGTKKLESNVFI